METGLAIISTTEIVPAEHFKSGGSRAFLESVKMTVREQASKLDISTKKGRDAIASLAYQVARTSTGVDDLGKELVEGWKTQAKVVDAERKLCREELAALKDEVRQPLTDWENADKIRVAVLEFKVVTMSGFATLAFGATVEDIEARISEVNALDMTNMQEFTSRAELAEKQTREYLGKALAEAQRRDAEAAEMAKLRAEAAERERKESDERIAKEAREKAQREAEEERNRIEQEKFQAEAWAKQAEAARIAAQEQAERDAKAAAERQAESERLAEERRVAAEARAKQEAEEAAKRYSVELLRAEERRKQEAADAIEREKSIRQLAAEKAERDRQAAIEAERERVAAEARKVAAETEAREKDKKHKSVVMGKAKNALIALGIPEDQAKSVVIAIQRGQVPNVRIEF